jgi:hypothetical protein
MKKRVSQQPKPDGTASINGESGISQSNRDRRAKL